MFIKILRTAGVKMISFVLYSCERTLSESFIIFVFFIHFVFHTNLFYYKIRQLLLMAEITISPVLCKCIKKQHIDSIIQCVLETRQTTVFTVYKPGNNKNILFYSIDKVYICNLLIMVNRSHFYNLIVVSS